MGLVASDAPKYQNMKQLAWSALLLFTAATRPAATLLAPGERAPYDPDAT